MQRGMYYRRDGTQLTDDVIEWAKEFEHADRIVKQQTLWNGLDVSTVFLGLNHQLGDGPPLIFETMVFTGNRPSGWLDEHYMDRYSTEAEAMAGHVRVVRRYRWWPLWILPMICNRGWWRLKSIRYRRFFKKIRDRLGKTRGA